MKTAIRKKWILSLLLILLFSGNNFSQLSEGDKLQLLIAKEKNDTSKINLLIKYGLDYAENDSVAIIYLKEAYDLSVKKNYRFGLAYGQYYKTLELSEKGRYNEAIYTNKQCIEAIDSMNLIVGRPLWQIRSLFNLAGKQVEKFQYYSEKTSYYKLHGPSDNIRVCFHGIAGYYGYLADYDKAIEYYMRSRDIAKSIYPAAYINETQIIGSMYLEWGNLEMAEIYLKSGLKAMDSLNIFTNNFFCYKNLGDLYLKRGDYAQALQYYMEARHYAATSNSLAINLVNCAEVYLLVRSRDSVRIYLDKADKIRRKENLRIISGLGSLEIDYEFHKYYMAIEDKKRALQHLEAALQEAQLERYLPFILKYSFELHSFLLKQGDSTRSLRYLVLNYAIQDSLNTMNVRARIATFEIEQQQQKKENEIEQLQAQKTTQRNYYLIGSILLLLIVFAVLSRLRYKRKRDKEQLTSNFEKQLAQAETKALRAQMNPHFIFNSLNSINNFVTDQKHEIASDYLLKFSKLIRLILDNSRSETIPLDKELETLQLYVQLESIRFENHFKYVVNIADNTSTGSIMIPPMLLQPFIENAIWHGLMQKRNKGTITVDIRKEDEKFLHISITDDGIGREKAAEMKSKSATHRSHGLKVTSERIEMMNKLNSTGAQVHIIDLKDEQGNALGTRVELVIPF